MDNAEFWGALERLVATSEVVIDRPRGSRHPRFGDVIYPLDYGYLKGTSAIDGGGVDLWRGSDGAAIVGLIATVDLGKRDAEIKLLIGCTRAQCARIEEFHNDFVGMRGLFVAR